MTVMLSMMKKQQDYVQIIGFESYGLWWFIIELMRKESDFKLDYDKKVFRSIKVLTGTTIDVEKFINDCINEYELFALEGNKFYSKSFLNRMNLMIEKQRMKSEQAREAGRKSAEARRQRKDNDISTPVEQPLGESLTNVERTLQENATNVEQPLEKSQRNSTELNKIKSNQIKLN